ncbi:MAG: hypothetical protein CM1200mP15_16510 [Dehalococcoidia bacterium]|nr:MAG: hypothetical protein CM1200mP15_16510 [Dehalococcoidia bacterium]
MHIGLNMAFPQSSGNITDVALLAEDLGFESIGSRTSDHACPHKLKIRWNP